MTKILIVEDEFTIARATKEILGSAGYEAHTVTSAEEALQKIRGWIPDLVVTDIGLPGMSGMELCRLFKKDSAMVSIPIIMLTVRKQIRHRVDGLDAGADDYLIKPFAPQELLARVRACLRCYEQQGSLARILRSQDVELNLDSCQVKVLGKLVEMRPKEFEFLSLFLRNKERVLTYSFLAEMVWGKDSATVSNEVKWWVHELRGKLGKASERIKTVINMGYKFTEEGK